MKTYLLDYDKLVNRQIALLEESAICKQNKALILKFKDHNLMNNVSLPRIIRQLGTLRLVAEHVKTDFPKATKEDFEQFILWLQSQKYSIETIDTHKKIIKVFYRWIGNGECPESVKWIKSTSGKSKKLPEEMLTEEEVRRLIAVAEHKRDKAFIASVWESGCRIGEIGTLLLKHVVFDDLGCQILVDGKTGMRRIRLVTSAPYLLEWINQHPLHDNPSAPLWINIDRRKGHQTGYANFKKILGTASRKAGIKKPINPHHFRHSRATYMAQFLTEAQMKEYFGWAQDSSMAARYVHLSGKQVDDAILKMYGLKKQEEQETILKREPCPRCKNLNDVNHQYCEKCWLPLTPQATSEVEEVRQKDQEAMVAIMKLLELSKTNPGIIREMISKAQQVRG